MRHLFRFSAISIILFGIASCNDSYDKPKPVSNIITFTAELKGSNEVPPPDPVSTKTGTATLSFNNTTKIFTITVTHNVTNPTDGHIHKGAVGVSGPPIFPFITFASPITYTSIALTPEQEADLKAGLYYVNIHSAAPYTAGEIRGQLIKYTAPGGGGGY